MSPGVSPVLFVSPDLLLVQKFNPSWPKSHPKNFPPTGAIHGQIHRRQPNSYTAGLPETWKVLKGCHAKTLAVWHASLYSPTLNFNMSEPFPKASKNMKLFDAKCSRGTLFFLHYLISCPIISLSKSQRAHPQRCHWRPECATGRNRFSTFCLLLDRLQGNEEEGKENRVQEVEDVSTIDSCQLSLIFCIGYNI